MALLVDQSNHTIVVNISKKFSLLNHLGDVEEDMLKELMEEGHKDIKQVIKERKLAERTKQLKAGIVDVPIVEKAMY